MKFARASSLFSLLATQLIVFFPTSTLAQSQNAHVETPVFGMHMSMNTDPWPTGQVPGSDRMWNAWGAQRLKVNTAQGGTHYTGKDFLPLAPHGTKTYCLSGNRRLVHVPSDESSRFIAASRRGWT
jgi:hypothetical protein